MLNITSGLEFDLDGDGVLDSNARFIDIDGDGMRECVSDTNHDGVLDTALSDDHDGSLEYAYDTDGDGDFDTYLELMDADGNGMAEQNYLYYDSDNDGIVDSSMVAIDNDGNGTIDISGTGVDTDGDGVIDTTETYADLDGDGVADMSTSTQQMDLDGDGIFETSVTDVDNDLDGETDYGYMSGDTDLDGDSDFNVIATDNDNDGVADTYEVEVDTGIDGMDALNIVATDMNEDGVADAMAMSGGVDIDGDGTVDIVAEGVDYDGDGMLDDVQIYAIDQAEADQLIDIEDQGYSFGPDQFDNFDADNADNDSVIGDPEESMQEWEFQGPTGRCAIYSQKFVIEEFTGQQLDIEEMADIAEANGWFSEEGGTPANCMNKLLDYYGIENEMSFHNDISDINECLESGGRVIVAIDSGEIWDGETDNLFTPGDGADHAVEVIGVDYSDPDNPMVILNDSGHPDGCGSMIPMDEFVDAWEDSGCQMIECIPA